MNTIPDRSTKKQWEDLAHESIADGLYWKRETRNAQLKAQRLAEALRDIRDCAHDPEKVAEAHVRFSGLKSFEQFIALLLE